MKQAIVIGCQPKNKNTWLKDLLSSLKGCKYPIEINYTDNFELATIKWARDGKKWDEFFFLPETTIIKDLKLFDMIFEENKGKSVSICKYPSWGGMYLVKYRQEILKNVFIPEVKSKKMAVYWEIVFNAYYAGLDEGNCAVLFPDMVHSNNFVEKYGRLNMVMGNEYIERYKGDWGQRPLT
ncbi:MAG: hypothetical protein QXV73_05320 [Candidatus Micrarchaeia archaeon]